MVWVELKDNQLHYFIRLGIIVTLFIHLPLLHCCKMNQKCNYNHCIKLHNPIQNKYLATLFLFFLIYIRCWKYKGKHSPWKQGKYKYFFPNTTLNQIYLNIFIFFPQSRHCTHYFIFYCIEFSLNELRVKILTMMILSQIRSTNSKCTTNSHP